MDKEAVINEAKSLRKEDNLEESNELLLALLEEYPEDPVVLFEVGGSYDLLGFANDAIPYYRQAIDRGLEGSDLQECYLCFGICQRAVGDFEEAIETLLEASEHFPSDNSIRAFQALTFYSSKRYGDAVSLLVDLLLETTSDETIQAYADTLDFYKDNLDEVWDS